MAHDSTTIERVSPAYSLTHAVRHVLWPSGGDVGVDELHAVLGLGLLVCAAPEEAEPSAWSGYARDAFLVEAARLFGATVRPIHPPSAARGLGGRAEFRQHFEASYRPLVLRALEHDQPVLAWGGWSEPYAKAWGLITEAVEGGVGVSGCVFGNRDASHPRMLLAPTPVALGAPPVQIYVVESVDAARPSDEAVVDAIITHTLSSLDGSLDEAFGVTTGAAVIGEWMRSLRARSNAGAGTEPCDVTFACQLAASARSLQVALECHDVTPNESPAGRILGASRAMTRALEGVKADAPAAARHAQEALDQLVSEI